MFYDIFSLHKSLPDFVYLVEMVCCDVGHESCTNKEIGGVHYLHTHTETAPILFRKEQAEKRRMKVRMQLKLYKLGVEQYGLVCAVLRENRAGYQSRRRSVRGREG
jgi:hypothetical protein